MLGEQRPVEERRLFHRLLDGGDGVFIPPFHRDIQPLMKQECQYIAMVSAGVVPMGRRESLLKQLRRDDIFLFEDPGEHYAHQMAQHGLALGAGLALLHPPRPLGDFPVELLAQGRGFQRGQQPVGS